MTKEIQLVYRDINLQAKEVTHFWIDHKEKLNFLYEKSISFLKNNENAIILGVGNGEDLPLKAVVDSFQSTTLLDIDKDTLLETKYSLPSELQKKVKSIVKDLTDADSKYTKKYSIALLVDKNSFTAKAILDKLLTDQSIFPESPSPEKFQFVISSTISTQLVTLFTVLSSLYSGHMKTQLLEKSGELATKAAENHVTQINNLLDSNNDSVALITSEQYVWSLNEEVENGLIASIIENPREMLIPDNQKEFEKHGLVITGRITENMLQNFDILHSEEWLWQFSESRQYLVKGWIVRKSIT